MSGPELLLPFAPPIYVFRVEGFEGLNGALREALLRERATHPGVLRSNRGGWHSAPDVAQRGEAHFQALCHKVIELARQSLQHMSQSRGAPSWGGRLGLQGWAMVMERGDYTVPHDHARADLSAVWYVDAGGEAPGWPESGCLTFVHPGQGASGALSALLPTSLSVRPEAGMLVVFPGYLQHYVHPYQGEGPRVSVAFNVTLG